MDFFAFKKSWKFEKIGRYFTISNIIPRITISRNQFSSEITTVKDASDTVRALLKVQALYIIGFRPPRRRLIAPFWAEGLFDCKVFGFSGAKHPTRLWRRGEFKKSRLGGHAFNFRNYWTGSPRPTSDWAGKSKFFCGAFGAGTNPLYTLLRPFCYILKLVFAAPLAPLNFPT